MMCMCVTYVNCQAYKGHAIPQVYIKERKSEHRIECVLEVKQR